MSLTLRIFASYFVIVLLACIVFLNQFMSELKPGMRQSAEHSLVDTANLLAELVPIPLNDTLFNSDFSDAINAFLQREHNAEIWSITKSTSSLRIYITDANGIVRYDSSGSALGDDYSQWNDVYLTLRGQYGARSTKSDPNNELSTVMHVAAPIIENGRIVGVLTVAKPNFSVQPFIDRAYEKVLQQGLLVIITSLLIVLIIAWLMTRSIRRLVVYAEKVSRGEKSPLPSVHESELSKLANAIENMKVELEGKDYVEQYIHTLTHELKSPISAIKGASELLHPTMSSQDHTRFVSNINNEAERMDDMVNRLLSLVTVEKQDVLVAVSPVSIDPLLAEVIESKYPIINNKNINVVMTGALNVTVQGDSFLLIQAVDNLLQNAIEFAHQGSPIMIAVEKLSQTVVIGITNVGSGIPDYAKDKIFNRFYSLPRPSTQNKSSGLGLCFVKQITDLHHGSIALTNTDTGVEARLTLPV